MKNQSVFRIQNLITILFFLITLMGSVFAQPNWSVNPVEYGGNMSYTAWVIVDGESVGHEDDLLGAFHDGVCRGVVSPTYNANSNRWVFFLTVFGDTQGEVIEFSYYDSQSDVEVDLTTEVPFIANHQYGSPLEPKATADVNTDLSAAAMISFSLPEQLESSIYGDTVFVLRPSALTTSDLVASFEASPGSLVKIGATTQFSDITENDFDQILNYTITSGDGSSTNDYFIKLVDQQMPIVASVFISGTEVSNPSDSLFAYINGVLVGKNEATFVPDINKYRFELSVSYFTADSQEFDIEFVHKNGVTDAETPVLPNITFSSLSVLGSLFNPIVLSDAPLFDYELLTFEIPGQTEDTYYRNDSIFIRLSPSVSYSDLTPEFMHSPGSIVTVADSVQYSEFTANDFTDYLTYRVFDQTRSNFRDYVVKVTYPQQSYVVSVWIDGIEINSNDGELFASYDGVNLSNASPTYVPSIDRYRFEISPIHYFSISNVVFTYIDGDNQSYNLVPSDIVFEENEETGTLMNPLVLSNSLLTGTSLSNYNLAEQIGATLYSQDTIILVVPSNIDQSSLIPTFESSPGAIVTINQEVQYAGFTTVDYNDVVNYRVYNQTRSDSTDYFVKTVYFTQNITASVWIDNMETISETDTLFAEVDGLFTVSAAPTYVADIDRFRFELEVLHFYDEGEITFTYYQASTGDSYSLTPNQSFVSDESLGTLYNPIVLSDVLLVDYELLTFEIPGQTEATYYRNDSIFVRLSTSVSYSDLTPEFTHSPGAIVTVGDSVQYSEFTSNDFTDYVTYRVYDQTRSNFRDYVVKVTYPRQNYVVSVWINGNEIDSNDGELFASFDGVNLGYTTPTYVSSIDKYRFEINAIHFFSSSTVHFTYIDGGNQSYNLVPSDIVFEENEETGTLMNPLVLSNTLLTGTNLSNYNLAEQVGVTLYNQDTITLIVPPNVDQSSLVPTFESSPGAIVTINQEVQYAGFTAVDYNDVVNYRVYNQTRSDSADYVVKTVYFDHDYTATTWINGVEDISPNDTLFAIVDGEHIVASLPTLVPNLNKYRFELTAFNAFATGVTEFIYWDAVTETSHNLLPIYSFQEGMADGTRYDPIYLSDMSLSGHEFVSFELPNQPISTVMYSDTILLRPEVGATITELYPIFEIPAGAKVYTNDSIQYSEHTAVDLTTPLVYTVFNWEKNDSSEYVVAVQHHQMDLDVAVIIDEVETTSLDDTVLVYANGRLLEKLIAYYQADIDRYRFNGTIYHFNELDELSFKYISEVGDTINLIDRVDFESGVSKGSAYDPIKLSNTLLAAPSFTDFVIDGQLFETVINANSILIRMPQDVELDSLVPSFEVTGHAIPMIVDSVQYSTISAVDFTFPVTYRLYSHDKSSYVDYLVKVVYYFQDITASVWIDNAETISETDTLFAYVDGVFSGSTTPTYVADLDRYRFEITAVHTADTGLVSFEFYHTITDSTYSLVANQVFQDSVLNGSLFNPVVLSNELIPTAELLSFEVPNQFGASLFTDGDTVIVRLDPVYDYANLLPTFETTPAAISLVEDSAYYSDFTVMDLSNPLAFDVYNHTKAFVRSYLVKAVHHKHDVVASVWIDELEQQSEDDTLYAFIDGELSAFATPTYVEAIDRYRFELEVLHYFEEGEITFTYYQVATGDSYSLIQNQSFVAGESSGTLFNPIVLSNVNLPDAAFLSFTFENQFGATYMEDQEIIIKLDPQSNDYTDLAPSFTVTPGSIVEVADSVQYADFTRGDFSEPVTYIVYNFDRSVNTTYTVSVVYYTVEGTFRAFVNNEELAAPTDEIYAQIDGEEMTSFNYISTDWDEFRFGIELIHYFPTGDIIFGYKNAAETFVAFPQTAFFDAGSTIGTDAEPFLLHSPIIDACELKSFGLEGMLEPAIIEDDKIILLYSQTTDLSDLVATFELSLGASLYHNGNSVMYSDITENSYNQDVFLDVVCPNDSVLRFEIEIQLDDFTNVAASSLVSPNGDGINDTWKVDEVEKFYQSTFKIYDNHARVVFEGVGYDNSWGGEFEGKLLPVGSYFYTIESPDGTINRGVISLIY